MILPIVIHPNDVLRARAVMIEDTLATEVHQLGSNMALTMRQADGVGLAGPQVGASLRICVIRGSCVSHALPEIKELVDKDKDLILINPKILDRSTEQEWGEEGCLSIPGIFGEVLRNKRIQVSAVSKQGSPLLFTAQDFFARVIQHETDHLDGILFIDKARNIKVDKHYVSAYRKMYA